MTQLERVETTALPLPLGQREEGGSRHKSHGKQEPAHPVEAPGAQDLVPHAQSREGLHGKRSNDTGHGQPVVQCLGCSTIEGKQGAEAFVTGLWAPLDLKDKRKKLRDKT